MLLSMLFIGLFTDYFPVAKDFESLIIAFVHLMFTYHDFIDIIIFLRCILSI